MMLMEQVKTITKFKHLEALCTDDRTQVNVYVIAKVKDISDRTVYHPETQYKINVFITDGVQTKSFYLWKPIEEVMGYLALDGVYKFYFTLSMYKGSPSLKYNSSTRIEDEDILKRFNLQKFRTLLQDNYTYFMESVRKIRDFRLRRLVEVCYGLGERPPRVDQAVYSRRLDKQANGSGSISRHDNYPGGIINHMCGMLRQVDALESIYGNSTTPPIARIENGNGINWDLVRVLVFLHDLGKQETYSLTAGGRVIRRDGTRLEHEATSVMLVSKYLRDMEPEYLLTYAEEQEILGGILNHGELSFKKSPEEQILSAVDMCDSILVDALTLD